MLEPEQVARSLLRSSSSIKQVVRSVDKSLRRHWLTYAEPRLSAARQLFGSSPLSSALAATPGDLAKEVVAGAVASIVLIANIVSFAALFFPGDLAAGIPTAIWAMLIGSSICGIIIATCTSLPPIATGIDSPTGAVLVVLSATIAPGAIAAGGNVHAAVSAVMLVFSVVTFLSGLLLYALGAARVGSYFRFVPYSVVGGFLAATGWFLVIGAIRMALGRTPSLDFSLALSGSDQLKLISTICTLLLLLGLRRWVKSAFAMPAALLSLCIVVSALLHMLGLSAPEKGWYLPSLGHLQAWSPFAARTHFTWGMVGQLLPEALAVTFVALISLVTKISSIEVTRRVFGDIDRELWSHGIGSLLAAPLGGIMTGLQNGSSRLLEQAGSTTRRSGVAAAVILGVVGLVGLDLPALVPIPVAAGLVLYLAYVFLADGLWRMYFQRAWLDLALALFIALVCIRYGYVIGVVCGIVCSCLLFAVSCAHAGVIRRHATRAQYGSNVARSAEASRHLSEHGEAIQIYCLSGYVFFGSSEGVVERVRSDINNRAHAGMSYVILDFGLVFGADSSAIVSLTKLRNYCDNHNVTLAYSALPAAKQRAFQDSGLFGGSSRHRAFVDLNAALAWCEDQLLHAASLDTDLSLDSFEPWLKSQLPDHCQPSDLVAYLERRDVNEPQILYRQGEPADTILLVAAGSLTINLERESGNSLCLRRFMTHTVVGEMGFVRHAARSATVCADGPAVFFTLTRTSFDRMRKERPDLATAFDEFIMRVLAERLEFANREIVARTP
jgi:sulfate permease, SulP family